MLKNWEEGLTFSAGVALFDPLYTGTILPITDNASDIGSELLSYRNAHFQTAVYATSCVGNWSASATGLYTLGTDTYGWLGLKVDAALGADADIDIIKCLVTGTPKFWWDETEDAFALTHNLIMADGKMIQTGDADGDYFTIGAVDDDDQSITELLRFVGSATPYTLASQPILVANDILFKLGTDSDIVFLNRSTSLSADEELANVIVGTSDHNATVANTLIISNIAEDGDILGLVNDGGNSIQWLFVDGSTGVTHLGRPGTPTESLVTGDVFMSGQLEITSTFFPTRLVMNTAGGYFRIHDTMNMQWGSSQDSAMQYTIVDTDARYLHWLLPQISVDASNVPVVAFLGAAGYATNLGFWTGQVQPLVTVVDDDADSWFGITFSADDTPHLDCGGVATLIGINKGLTLSGSIATAIDFAGTYTGNVIDFSNATIAPAGSGGPCFLRAGTYASPIDLSTDQDQSGMLRFYSTTSAGGTSYDRIIFACAKTTNTKGVFPVAGLAEVNAVPSGNGPTQVGAAQFIAHLNSATAKLDARSGNGWANFYGSWLKVASEVGSIAAAGSVVAPLWVDTQMNGTVNGEYYSIFATSGTAPDAFVGFEASAGCGWTQLLYFDDTCYNLDPVSGSGLKVLLNATQKYIFLMDTATQQVDADFNNTPNSGDGDTDDLIDKMRDALVTFGLVAAS